MKIAIVGWGSLIWDKHEFPKIVDGWTVGGPSVPVEFSRVSSSRHRSLTLVIDPMNGVDTPTRYAFSKRTRLKDAICDLRTRENTVYRNIGFVDIVNNVEHSTIIPGLAKTIRKWASNNGFDAAIWTDLPSNFKLEVGKPFSIDTAIEHLHSLPYKGCTQARKYIARAPAEVKTPLRQAIQSDKWFRSRTTCIAKLILGWLTTR